MPTATRIYLVTIGARDRLVRAAHPRAALVHVIRDIAAVKVASQDDLVDCLSDGIEVESASEEAAPAPAPASDNMTLPFWPDPESLSLGAPVAAPVAAEDSSLPLWPMPTPLKLSDPQQALLPEPEDDGDDDTPPATARTALRARMAAKYRCPATGQTWSGRGLKPTWLRVALDGGKQISDFVVTPVNAQEMLPA